ncbi:MAG: nucleoside deaminase [Verrucomicrobia bacterium]|nr:nucleoside deaminase [Verrucomicrobiota bacterium]
MRLAIEEAKKAYEMGEVPVGAVLVWNNEVIARAHNLVEARKDASAHAELLCMAAAAAKLSNWRLLNTTLYSTLEPCSMCAGGMLLSRVGTLVWGAPDLRHGAHGSWINVLDQPHPTHRIQVRKGVLAGECSELMRSFFQNRRLKEVDNGVGIPVR